MIKTNWLFIEKKTSDHNKAENQNTFVSLLETKICHFSSHQFTDMRRDVQEIFRNTPHSKQVMMFSATLSKEIRPVCRKFMQDVIDVH